MLSKSFFKEKLWPFLAGLGSSMIMFLAFFLPSLQDQFDRNDARTIINEYENLGNEFFNEEKYDIAEQAYQKAFELSDSRRLDLDKKRLVAKINRINMDPKWGSEPPEDLTEIDFEYVLHLKEIKSDVKERVSVLNSYGLFLVSSEKLTEAEKMFNGAIESDSSDARAYINKGSLFDQKGNRKGAMAMYLKAISLDKDNARAHYNLAQLYIEQGMIDMGIKQLQETIRLDSSEEDARAQLEKLHSMPGAEKGK